MKYSEEEIKKLLSILFPNDWKKNSVFWGGKNIWLWEKTNMGFPSSSTVKEDPSGCHFIFLFSKFNDKCKCNLYFPCSSVPRTPGCFIPSNSPVLSTSNKSPFRFDYNTYLVYQFLIPVDFYSEENIVLEYLGVAPDEGISNYELVRNYWGKMKLESKENKIYKEAKFKPLTSVSTYE